MPARIATEALDGAIPLAEQTHGSDTIGPLTMGTLGRAYNGDGLDAPTLARDTVRATADTSADTVDDAMLCYNIARVLEAAPLMYVRDTSLDIARSLGAARGDVDLTPLLADGAALDHSSERTAGNYIRIRRRVPLHGETLRVRTDVTRGNSVLPLMTLDDASVELVITSDSLEIQAVGFCGSSKRTRGNVSTSGHRLVFGDETMGATTGGFDAGCLLWDAAAVEEADLEALVATVDVLITSDDISSEDQTVAVVGNRMRDNVPQLTVTDLGRDSCADAEDAASKNMSFSSSEAPWTAATAQDAAVLMQMTEGLRFGAMAADVKGVGESLTQCCVVDVARDKYGDDASCVTLDINSVDLSAEVDATAAVVPVQRVALDAPLGAKHDGTRVAGAGVCGTGAYAASSPAALAPSTQKPSAPTLVLRSEVLSPTEVPVDTCGSPVSTYNAERDRDALFVCGCPLGEARVLSDTRGGVADVQLITLTTPQEGRFGAGASFAGRFLRGTFTLSFDNQMTAQLPYDASAAAVEDAFKALGMVGNVGETCSLRCSAVSGLGLDERPGPQGYAWLVTFLDAAGDQYTTFASRYQPVDSHRLSIDGLHLLSCADTDRAGRFKSFGVTVVATGSMHAFSRDRDETAPLAGCFRVEFVGVVGGGRIMTGVAMSCSAAAEGDSSLLEQEREAMGMLGGVTLALSNATHLECRGENIITITFGMLRDDAAPLLVSSSPLALGLELPQWTRETSTGVPQPVVPAPVSYAAGMYLMQSVGFYWRVNAVTLLAFGRDPGNQLWSAGTFVDNLGAPAATTPVAGLDRSTAPPLGLQIIEIEINGETCVSQHGVVTFGYGSIIFSLQVRRSPLILAPPLPPPRAVHSTRNVRMQSS